MLEEINPDKCEFGRGPNKVCIEFKTISIQKEDKDVIKGLIKPFLKKN